MDLDPNKDIPLVESWLSRMWQRGWFKFVAGCAAGLLLSWVF
jgi:hypothetical protein